MAQSRPILCVNSFMTFLSLQEPLPVPECSKAFTLVSLSLFCRFLCEFSVQHILDPLVAFLVVSTFFYKWYLNHLQLNVYNISVQHPLKTWSSYSGVSLIQRAWLNWPIWIVVWGWGMVAYSNIPLPRPTLPWPAHSSSKYLNFLLLP